MTYVARSEYCSTCGGMHPKFIDGCPNEHRQLDPIPWPTIDAKVDPTSNVRGPYRTVWFKCPKCGFSYVLMKSNFCSDCGAKLSWGDN